MIVAGVMSGTSCDGINVAIVDIAAGGGNFGPKVKFLGHSEIPYPRTVRTAVLAAMNADCAKVADLSQLNFLLATLYGDAVLAASRQFRLKIELVGCHGQTLYHQGEPSKFLGHHTASTWQTGDGSVIAARVGVPAVSDFRPADIATGGKGAPLVPFFDYCYFRDRRVGRVVQNIGGIANLTAIPAAASIDDVFAFDTGPGNMVIDALAQQFFGQPFDRDGSIAASGTVLGKVVSQLMRFQYFRREPPKTAGREEFGRDFVRSFLKQTGRADKRDIVATATALTARSIANALQRFVLKKNGYEDFIVSGGGTKNSTLMALLANLVNPLGLKIRRTDDFGIPSEAKEAVAFALLAYQTWNRKASNIPSATAAKRPAILGKVSYV